VIKVNPNSGELRDRIVIETRAARFPLSLEPVSLAVGASAVWALERGRGQLNRIDPETGASEVLTEGLGGSSSIAVGTDAVWLGGPDGVQKIDPRTGALLGTESIDKAEKSRYTSIAVGRDAVWFVGDSSKRLWQISPESVDTFNSVVVGESPSAVAVGKDGSVWVASSVRTELGRYAGDRVENVELGTTSSGLVSYFGRIWTSPGAAAD
jgi:streptogramin lyase